MMKCRVFFSLVLFVCLTLVISLVGIKPLLSATSNQPYSSASVSPSGASVSENIGIVFQDDFNDGSADGWSTTGDGTWFVENNEYVVDMGSGYELVGISVAGDSNWTDYTYEIDLQGNAGVDKVILARYVDNNNYYSLNIRGAYSDINLFKLENGVGTLLASVPYVNGNDIWYHVKLALQGSQILVYVNDTLLIDITDNGTTLNYGKIGFQGWTGATGVDRVRYDNVAVYSETAKYVVFSDDFSTNPNTNNQWRIYRRFPDDPDNQVSWDEAAQVLYLTRSVDLLGVAMFADYELKATQWNAQFKYKAGGGTGADGLVFMFYKDEVPYNLPDARPDGGATLGFQINLPATNVAGYGIEFDNFSNIYIDPSANHIAIIKDDVSNHLAYVDDTRTEDNAWHNVLVEFDNGHVVVWVDGEVALDYVIANPDYTYSGVGFSSATGIYTNNHIIDDFVLTETLNCTAATAKQPILMVTGWGGSETELNEDEQLKYFENHLTGHDYVEGCNLFYAQDTSPYRFLHNDSLSIEGRSNATVIRDELCSAYEQFKSFNPSWEGHFDIIGYSYGGLRARAYLERVDLYGSVCPGTQNRVYVDNLFTMGTPHGGEFGDLPFAALIGLGALIGGEWPALDEMRPNVRDPYNKSHEQPPDVSYHLLSGDARSQAAYLPTLLRPVYRMWAPVWLLPNDFAVHRWSAHALLAYSWRYPNTNYISTPDLHGQVPSWVDPLGLLRSYVNPNTTFESKIWPCIIGSADCQSSVSHDLNQQATPGSREMVEQQNQPLHVTAAPLMDIQAGTLTNSDVATGHFEMSGADESQISLYWSGGDVDLALADPIGTPIDSQSASSDPNIDYLSLDTGFGLMSSYQITNTLIGTWTYTVTANALSETAGYRLLAVPSTPVAVSGSVPGWLPNNNPVVITATVSYSTTTPVVGGSVTARILRPDDTTDTINLLDDGNNQDGASNDGVFGVTYSQTSQGGFYGILFTATGNYNSEAYKRTATTFFTVAPENASLNGQYSDSGIDDDGNNLYEWLEVSAGLMVTEASTYTLSAELYAGSTFITHASTQVWLEAGTQMIALRFDGEAIYYSGLDGPYMVRNALLLDESRVTLLIEAADYVHTTPSYNHNQFDGRQSLIYLPVLLKK